MSPSWSRTRMGVTSPPSSGPLIKELLGDHFVELDLARRFRAETRLWLIANGWIYPTDSSINLAIGQGHQVQPHGLSLEAEDGAGRWVVVSPDLGFPAGKNKTI